MKHLQILLSTGMLIGLMCLQPTFAEGLAFPGNAAGPFSMKFSENGKINSVDASKATIVLDGRSYTLSPETRVLGPRGGLLPHEALRKGIFVAFNTAAGGAVISEIWIIPVD